MNFFVFFLYDDLDIHKQIVNNIKSMIHRDLRSHSIYINI